MKKTWLVWLSGLSAGPRTERSLVWFPVRAHAWVAGQVPGWGRARGNQSFCFMVFLSLSPSLPLSKNKYNLKEKNPKMKKFPGRHLEKSPPKRRGSYGPHPNPQSHRVSGKQPAENTLHLPESPVASSQACSPGPGPHSRPGNSGLTNRTQTGQTDYSLASENWILRKLGRYYLFSTG